MPGFALAPKGGATAGWGGVGLGVGGGSTSVASVDVNRGSGGGTAAMVRLAPPHCYLCLMDLVRSRATPAGAVTEPVACTPPPPFTMAQRR